MERTDFERREEAWAAFHEWERKRLPTNRSLAELLAWLDEALRVARRAGHLTEETPDEKAARWARVREALASIRTLT